MALRCLVRKMPALGLRSPTGPVHALSPAARSRLMGTKSQGHPTNLPCSAGEQHLKTYGEGQIIYSKEETLARLRESINVMKEEVNKKMEMICQNDAANAAFQKDIRRDSDDFFNTINKLLNVCLAAALGSNVLLLIRSKYQA